MTSHSVTFVPSGRGKAQCAPDPDYPRGKSVDISDGRILNCRVDLPYPAPECGFFHVTCSLCSLSVAVTAAGRPDDPIEVRLPCKWEMLQLMLVDPVRRMLEVRRRTTQMRGWLITNLADIDAVGGAVGVPEDMRKAVETKVYGICARLPKRG